MPRLPALLTGVLISFVALDVVCSVLPLTFASVVQRQVDITGSDSLASWFVAAVSAITGTVALATASLLASRMSKVGWVATAVGFVGCRHTRFWNCDPA